MPRRLGLVAVTCALALLAVPAASVSAEPAASTPAAAPVASPAASNASLAWGSCDRRFPSRVECGTLTVPRDWGNASAGPTYELAVARIRATGPRLGVLTFNTGGPGGTAFNAILGVSNMLPYFVRRSFDVVAMDPRAVGRSQPFLADCPSGDGPDLPPTGPVDWNAIAVQAFENQKKANATCLEKNPVDAQYVGTWQVVRDIDALRSQLGEEQITFWGMSYGSTVGRVYAQTFPTRVRALVLDGTITPTPSIHGYAREHIWDDGQAVHTMLGAFGAHAVANYSRVMRYLDRRVIETDDPNDPITRWIVASIVAGGAAYQSAWPQMNAFITAFAMLMRQQSRARVAEVVDMIESMPDEVRFPERAPKGSSPAFQFINCSDMHDRPTGEQIGAIAEQAAGVSGIAYGLMALGEGTQCAGLPALGRPVPQMRYPLRLATPPIIVNSVADNRTPWYGARMTANMFTGSGMVNYAGTQHVTYGRVSACVNAAVSHYLLTQQRGARSVACPLEYTPVPLS